LESTCDHKEEKIMAKVKISHNGQTGTIEYIEGDLENFKVSFPDVKKSQEIIKYFTTEREFHIPESQRIDDYRVDKALPTDHITYFELALSTLYANTDVWVEW